MGEVIKVYEKRVIVMELYVGKKSFREIMTYIIGCLLWGRVNGTCVSAQKGL